MKTTVAAIVLAVSIGAASAAVADTRLVNFPGAGPFFLPFSPVVINGVTVTAGDGSLPANGNLQSIGLAAGGQFAPEFYGFATGGRFDALGFHVEGAHSRLMDWTSTCLNWADPSCGIPYVNAYALGYRGGVEVARFEFATMDTPNAARIFDVKLSAAFADLDYFVIGAAIPGALQSTAGMNLDNLFCDNNACTEFVVSDVALRDRFAAAAPEPSTWAMMLIGLFGLALAHRRKAIAGTQIAARG